jgi:O-acetylhomoserine (thiol)-lyase
VPLIVDNTVATPPVPPFEHGADIVVHSLTKYIGGHGTSIGGIVVDSASSLGEHKARFPLLNTPDPSYHGVTTPRPSAPPPSSAAAAVPLRNTGAALSPFNAFLILQAWNLAAHGAPLRERAQGGALPGAAPAGGVGQYAGLPDHPDHALAQRYMGGKPASILSASRGAEAARASSTRSSWWCAWSTSAMPSRWPATRPPPPPPAQRGGTGAPGQPGHGAAVDRHRAQRRHPRRPNRPCAPPQLDIGPTRLQIGSIIHPYA